MNSCFYSVYGDYTCPNTFEHMDNIENFNDIVIIPKPTSMIGGNNEEWRKSEVWQNLIKNHYEFKIFFYKIQNNKLFEDSYTCPKLIEQNGVGTSDTIKKIENTFKILINNNYLVKINKYEKNSLIKQHIEDNVINHLLIIYIGDDKSGDYYKNSFDDKTCNYSACKSFLNNNNTISFNTRSLLLNNETSTSETLLYKQNFVQTKLSNLMPQKNLIVPMQNRIHTKETSAKETSAKTPTKETSAKTSAKDSSTKTDRSIIPIPITLTQIMPIK